uniref:Uncharacterized protein n=1 Tax=Mustela putorius furo TaxID=9669 RepID=M3XXE2_MUSPF
MQLRLIGVKRERRAQRRSYADWLTEKATLKGQIVISWKSLPDDWVQWTHQTRFQLSYIGRRVELHACAPGRDGELLDTAGCLRARLPCCLCRLPRATSRFSTGPSTQQEAHIEPEGWDPVKKGPCLCYPWILTTQNSAWPTGLCIWCMFSR